MLREPFLLFQHTVSSNVYFILLWSVWASYWEHWTNCLVYCPGVVSLTSALLAIISLLCWWCRNVSYVPSVSAERQRKVKMQKCQSPPACSTSLGCSAVTFSLCWLSLLKTRCSVMWPEPSVSLLFLLQTRTLRTMTRWTAAAPRPRPKEHRCPGGRRWAWVHFDAPPPPPAPSLQVRADTAVRHVTN